MGWGQYYRTKEVISLREQLPYYEYFLSCLSAPIRQKAGPLAITRVALGGINPNATQPEDFIELCVRSLPGCHLQPFIFDQNKQALETLSGEGYTALRFQLEALPAYLHPLHLLVCDYTLDFMSDRQLRQLNQTLPDVLDQTGLLLVTHATSLIPRLREFQARREWGVKIHIRTAEKLAKLLSDFKALAITDTGNNNGLIAFARKDNPYEEHRGHPIGLYPDEGHFADWLSERQSTATPDS